MANFVQEYRSTDVGLTGFPATGIAGSLIALLDAVLVNGGTPMPVTGLSESGATVTATIPVDITLENFDQIVIAGATPAGANGMFPITVVDSTHFSYTGPGGLGAITGSITYRRAPLGWTKPFSGANLAAYRGAVTPGMPQFFLRVDDAGLTAGGAREAAVRGYETMSSIDVGTGPFPTTVQIATGLCWRKSTTLDATARTWSLIGDEATFYLVVNSDVLTTSGRQLCGFGGFTSFKPGDLYNAMISGSGSFNLGAVVGGNNGLSYASSPNTVFAGQLGLYAPRASTMVGGAVPLQQIARHQMAANTIGSVSGSIGYPSPVDGALWVDSTFLFELAGACRGRPRGLYAPCHTIVPLVSDYDTVTNVAGLPGVTLFNILVATNAAGEAFFDRYGPW